MRFPRSNKYRAKRTNGFSSKLESAVHDILRLRELAGEIKDIKCQQSVVLVPGPRNVRIAWKVDFSFEREGKTEYCEAKGVETADYKLKLKLWRANPPAKLIIYKGNYRRPFVAEVIETKEEIK